MKRSATHTATRPNRGRVMRLFAQAPSSILEVGEVLGDTSAC